MVQCFASRSTGKFQVNLECSAVLNQDLAFSTAKNNHLGAESAACKKTSHLLQETQASRGSAEANWLEGPWMFLLSLQVCLE